MKMDAAVKGTCCMGFPQSFRKRVPRFRISTLPCVSPVEIDFDNDVWAANNTKHTPTMS